MPKFPIAVLISGGGTTLKNLIEWQRLGELGVEFAVVISSNPKAKGLEFAREAEIPCEIVSRKCFVDNEAHSEAVFSLCRKHNVQLVVMGGYLEFLKIPADFENRVTNIHPSLIPAFCGHGFYGERVHKAVIEMGVKLTGCTVHFVDNQFDHGPIIAQRSCAVLDCDTAESVQRRVAELEFQLYPEAIDAIARCRVCVEGRKVHVRAIV
jgi:phosphoribosylglycinamide formyltransferase 1